MDLSESDNPLLNEYKLRYVLKLLLQTFLGGIRLLFDLNVPRYIYFIQMFIWILPFLIGLLFTLLVQLADCDEQLMALVFGLTMLVFHLVFQVFGLLFKHKLISQQRTTHTFLADEDQVEFVSFLSVDTFEFLIPKKKLTVNYVLHPLLCGVVCSFSLMFLLPKRTYLMFDYSGSWIYHVISWLIVCIACYPLIGQHCKEPASFRVIDNWGILPISRCFYVLGFGVFSYVIRFYPNYPILERIDFAVHIIFLFFPFFWLFGFLPPLDALLSWCGEQTLIHLLGGSMMATDGRLFIMLVLSWMSVIIFHFIPLKTAALVILASLTMLISLDVCTLMVSFVNKLTNFGLTRLKNEKKCVVNETKCNTIWFLCYLVFVFTMANVITALSELYLATLLTTVKFNILAGVLFFIAVLNKLLCCFQNVYIFFSILRNPLYSKVCKRYGRMWLIHMASAFIRLIALPLCLILTVSTLLITQQSHPRSFISSIMLFRAYRMIWQDTTRCCYDVLFYIILIWANFNPPFWNSLDPSIQLFTLSMLLFFLISLTNQLWFMILLLLNSQSKQKNQQKKVKTAIMITVCLLPLTLFVIAMTTLTTSPLLPLFTLPLYIVGFPRPLRVWPQASSSTKSASKDWIYYKQLSASLADEMQSKFRSSGINTFSAGNYFLARFQDRLIWITILESGFTHCNFVIKGLELQETSCHTLEAEHVDNVFMKSFDTNVNPYNEYLTSVLTPKFSLDVDAYSDAKNVLTGIIDSPETLKSISNFFPKVLLWVLIKYCLHRRKMGLEDVKCSHSQQIALGDCFTPLTEDTLVTTARTKSSEGDMIIPKMPFVEHNGIQDTHMENQRVDDDKIPLTPVSLIKTAVKPIKLGKNVDDSDDEFADFGFSDDELPSESDQSSDDDNEYDDRKNPAISENPTLRGSNTNYRDISSVSKVIDPPCYWKREFPFTEDELSSYSSLISKEWYEYIILSLNLDDGKLIVEDSVLFKFYKLLVLSCFYIVDVAGVRENSSVKEGPGHVLKVFYGLLPWSPHTSWLEQDEELKELVVHAYRYAFKLAIDDHLIGEIKNDEEMLTMLTDYEDNWFIGEENSDKWMKNVLEEKPYLLSICQERRKSLLYTSRLLSKQLLEVPIAEVNKECVRGFWSALSLELYYMTNDDDERYSIQALPFMLRNIITQAADPPLGYPVYSSGLISVHM